MQRNMERSVGLRRIDLVDPVQHAAIPLVILYPAFGQERIERFGPYSLNAVPGAPIEGEQLSLVVISHGNSSTPWVHRDLAADLVRAGFAVALPEHPGNSRNDNSLAGTAANLVNRPRHIKLVVDASYTDPEIGIRLAPGRVGIIGNSIGAYTALAVAGGRPWAGPHETPDGNPCPLEVSHDSRVRALVLLSPATPWFMPAGTLTDVRIPIQMWSGDRDKITTPWHAELVKAGVPDPSLIDHRTIAGAGHFSFMSAFPPEMNRPDFPPAHDPKGFDRRQLQPYLHAEILSFLRRTL